MAAPKEEQDQEQEPVTVASSNGVQIAVHDLGGHGAPLLISHATGFHGRCYLPIATVLADRFHTVAFDYRGHGDTAQPDGVAVNWNRYGDDAVAMAESLAQQAGTPITAFGHSMGGACLLMAAYRRPELFSRLVLFEPIVPAADYQTIGDGSSPMVKGALARRTTFASYDEALANYASKPPLSIMTTEALWAYVRYGFRQDSDGVHLKCRPQIEAETFMTGGAHDTFQVLHEITTPTLVLTGAVSPHQPSDMAGPIAQRLPNGTLHSDDHMTHFGPMSHPAQVGQLIAG